MSDYNPTAGELRDLLSGMLAQADPKMTETRGYLQRILHTLNESGDSNFATEETVMEMIVTVAKFERALLDA